MLDDVELRELRIFLAVLVAAMRETGAQWPGAGVRAGCPLPWPASDPAQRGPDGERRDPGRRGDLPQRLPGGVQPGDPRRKHPASERELLDHLGHKRARFLVAEWAVIQPTESFGLGDALADRI